MANFYDNLEYDTAMEIKLLSQLIYELRDNYKAVLSPYGAEDEAALLLQIQGGTVAEHPAYEHYLAARILADTRETVRAVAGEHLREANQK